jgi:hypothetical protein
LVEAALDQLIIFQNILSHVTKPSRPYLILTDAAICCSPDGATMTNEHTLVPADHADEDFLNDHPEDVEFESLGDYHRMAAMHYSQAAKHHTLAGDADDHGHEESRNSHAFLAYRHQLVANQYAEIAVIESDYQGEEDEEQLSAT